MENRFKRTETDNYPSETKRIVLKKDFLCIFLTIENTLKTIAVVSNFAVFLCYVIYSKISILSAVNYGQVRV